jgi:hydrogenase nickel incorporation protein HypB
MCDTCGCYDAENGFKIVKPENFNKDYSANHHHENDSIRHGHSHGHGHGHEHISLNLTSIEIAQPVLAKNNLIAERNRGYFEAKKIKAFNLVSSPGSGKTTLLEQIIAQLKNHKKIYVIEGDQQTSNDAIRIKNAGANAIQINTGNGCHLDAEMINIAVKELQPEENSFLFIENVGNLVCPALFDLGENSRILVSSVTEGDDKPLKYPTMFESAHLCILNKIDLLPYVNFNGETFKNNALHINHHINFIETSATMEIGVKEVVRWLASTLK